MSRPDVCRAIADRHFADITNAVLDSCPIGCTDNATMVLVLAIFFVIRYESGVAVPALMTIASG